MSLAGMFCEGTVYDWSGVYFSSVVKPDEAFICAGYVAGMGAMTLGRFLADGFVTKYGPAKVLKVCGGLILGGLWLAAALPYLIPATLGFLLVGFGIYFCAFIHHDNLMQLCVLDGRSYHFAFCP